ncbi:hypothetical protein G6F37_006665 [Rhizopus arrhizus]|nr:hypothetical protein G6F38_011011 [Rhizopus arrhizus]KAG1157476.1 hypothetical protein G6F37_006665 [Rhizopus arrhizus]
MGLDEEFNEAKEFVSKISWTSTEEPVQLFETVIRYLGGFLSAFDLSNETIFLEKAVELANLLLPAFDTPTGVPYQYMNFTSGKPMKSPIACLAEVGSIQIEFTRLSELTGDWQYHYVGQRVYDSYIKMNSMKGLYPHLINVNTGLPVGDHFTWGGMADSFYEYLIKQLVTSEGKDQVKFKMVKEIISSLENQLLVTSSIDPKTSFLVEINGNRSTNRMDELACFAPASLILAARSFPKEFKQVEAIAERLLYGCYSAWDSTATGLAPEVFTWDVQSRFYEQIPSVAPVIKSYILRPETLESLYYFFVYTHNPVYQDMAWDIFNSLYTYCKTNSGYSGLYDVQDTEYPWDDREESFFFAETLKYLYLIFDDHKQLRFPFDQWVFNTEAHPLKIHKKNPTLLKK